MLTVRGQQHSFSTQEHIFLWKYGNFRDRKCLYLRGTRTPNLQIYAEYSNHLTYQGQTFAVHIFKYWLSWWESSAGWERYENCQKRLRKVKMKIVRGGWERSLWWISEKVEKGKYENTQGEIEKSKYENFQEEIEKGKWEFSGDWER